MTIDWNAFTPAASLGGGLLIGLATTILLLANGRIAGISGIVGGLLRPLHGDVFWRASFGMGLVLAPLTWRSIADLPVMQVDTDSPMLILAGLLVGIGTRYGAGCTSGHGVCGVSRASPRSLAATTTFMLGGFVTVFVMRHLAR